MSPFDQTSPMSQVKMTLTIVEIKLRIPMSVQQNDCNGQKNEKKTHIICYFQYVPTHSVPSTTNGIYPSTVLNTKFIVRTTPGSAP